MTEDNTILVIRDRPDPIKRELLYAELEKLGVPIKSGKIAADYEGFHPKVPVFTRGHILIGFVDVQVSKTPVKKSKSSEHRVHIMCKVCSAFIPFGRIAQHAGSKKCYKLRDMADQTRYGGVDFHKL